MSDRYIDFANSSLGHRLVAAIGLPSPVRLERWQAGRLRPVEGALLLGGGALATQVLAFANRLTDAVYSYGAEASTAPAWIPGHGPKLKAVVFDASALQHTEQLKQLREFFQPLLKNLDHSAHLVILGRAPESLSDPFAASAQHAWKASAAPWPRSCAAVACCSCCTWATAPKTSWKARCGFSSRPKALISPAR